MRLASSLLLALCSAGCMSYSFRGSESVVKKEAGPAKFVIKQYTFDCSTDTTATGWSIPRFAGRPVERAAVERMLLKKYPALFSDSEGIPVDVAFRVTGGRTEYGGLVVYMLTLGGYPGKTYVRRDTGTVSLSFCDAKISRSVGADFKFSSIGWLTLWTPFGLMMSDEPGGYDGPHRSGKGFMVAPHLDGDCYLDQQEVFLETVTDAIASSLSSLAPDEVQQLRSAGKKL